MMIKERRQRAADLEREAKELRRQEQAFLREADQRREELLERWRQQDKEGALVGSRFGGAEPLEEPSESPVELWQ